MTFGLESITVLNALNSSGIINVSVLVMPDMHNPVSLTKNFEGFPAESVLLVLTVAIKFPNRSFFAKFNSSPSSNFTPLLDETIVPALMIGKYLISGT